MNCPKSNYTAFDFRGSVRLASADAEQVVAPRTHAHPLGWEEVVRAHLVARLDHRRRRFTCLRPNSGMAGGHRRRAPMRTLGGSGSRAAAAPCRGTSTGADHPEVAHVLASHRQAKGKGASVFALIPMDAPSPSSTWFTLQRRGGAFRRVTRCSMVSRCERPRRSCGRSRNASGSRHGHGFQRQRCHGLKATCWRWRPS